MPFPIDIDVLEGTLISDGIQTLTSKETSHVRLTKVDSDGFLVYEVTPPKKFSSKTSLKDYLGEEQLIGTVTTVESCDGQAQGIYKYYRRPDGSYYASIIGKDQKSHGIELGKLSNHESPVSIVARNIAFKFDVKKFSRNDLKIVIPKKLTYGQKLKSILDILHKEGYLVKEIDQTSRNKAKELYTATERLKKVIIPSTSPEQA